ncbi:MAG: chemotaxis protein CheW, partial [Pseudomonadota bacterium]
MKLDDAVSRKKKVTAIDWRAIEQRMDAVRAAIEHTWEPSAEDTQRVLKLRALALAREAEPAAPGEHIEVVEFLLAHERYAIESMYVREVYPLENLTPLPCTPIYVLGIVNL